MAWTDLSAAFGYGTKLTSTQQQQLRDNVVHVHAFVNSASLTDHGPLLGSGTGAITAMAAGTDGQLIIGQSGADAQWKTISGDVTISAAGATTLGAGKISQSMLKTSTGEVSCSYTGENLTLPGGTYGFYPQIKSNSTTPEMYGYLAYNYSGAGATSYVTLIHLRAQNSSTCYAQQRYVTSSGEVFWIFILRDKTTKDIKAIYAAPDHPCFGNGGKPDVLPHPFGKYDEQTDEIVVINPAVEEVEAIERNRYDDGDDVPDKAFIESFLEMYDLEKLTAAQWPTKAVTVGLPREFAPGTAVVPIRKTIPQPKGIAAYTAARRVS